MIVRNPVVAKLPEILPQENYFLTIPLLLLECYSQSQLKLL